MRKLIQLTIALIVLSFIASSCSSGLSITKRRYNKGFFVERHKNSVAQPAIAAASEVKESKTTGKTAVRNEAIPAAAKKTVPDAVKDNNLTASAASKRTLKGEKVPATTAELAQMALFKPVKTVNTVDRLMKSAAPARGDALSLLWIVIVVILIVYLLGLLFDNFGLGNIIHVLAAIAVVLLILWLLRII